MRRGLVFSACAVGALVAVCSYAQTNQTKRPWKGYAILGSGNLTAVYSDDSRISEGRGLQHLYFRDYTADYVASTSFASAGVTEVGMKNFYTAQSTVRLEGGATGRVLCFVHPDDAVVLSFEAHKQPKYRFEAQLRKGLTNFESIDHLAIARWSNGTVLAIGPKDTSDKVTATGSTVVVTGKSEVLFIPATTTGEAISKAKALRRNHNLEATAGIHWESWMKSGVLPNVEQNYLDAYKRNLYCVKSATLNGQIPADITGQFVTNDMPQLYPRDAMMCARVLLLSGHIPEARQVIEFWADRRIPMKSPGEWYARYDAHGKAVDAGSGARYDEPEWDANGYFIYLLDMYHASQHAWLADRKFVFELADFLVAHIDQSGLLYEGGIVEWTGYLPATNMIDAKALLTAAQIAREAGDQTRARTYLAASAKITAALPQMFDASRQIYADVRFTAKKGPNNESLPERSGDKTYLWDTTATVGVIWGYPDHRAMALSNEFYLKNLVKLGGGMQYFDTTDPNLVDYGHAAFFFTTAYASQYQAIYGDKTAAKSMIDWMMRNANSYGLMPERINLDETVSPASPLSWCSAEFAAALLAWGKG